jgi:hypothetical protein
MQTNAYTYSDPVRPGMSEERPLYIHGCRHGITGAGKDDEEGIALCVDLVAMVPGEGASQDVPTVGQYACVALAYLL